VPTPPCGSRSTRSTRRPRFADAAARLTAVVVLPTPPLRAEIATTRFRAIVVALLSTHAPSDVRADRSGGASGRRAPRRRRGPGALRRRGARPQRRARGGLP